MRLATRTRDRELTGAGAGVVAGAGISRSFARGRRTDAGGVPPTARPTAGAFPGGKAVCTVQAFQGSQTSHVPVSPYRHVRRVRGAGCPERAQGRAEAVGGRTANGPQYGPGGIPGPYRGPSSCRRTGCRRSEVVPEGPDQSRVS